LPTARRCCSRARAFASSKSTSATALKTPHGVFWLLKIWLPTCSASVNLVATLRFSLALVTTRRCSPTMRFALVFLIVTSWSCRTRATSRNPVSSSAALWTSCPNRRWRLQRGFPIPTASSNNLVHA